jgi:hypothetical protein
MVPSSRQYQLGSCAMRDVAQKDGDRGADANGWEGQQGTASGGCRLNSESGKSL